MMSLAGILKGNARFFYGMKASVVLITYWTLNPIKFISRGKTIRFKLTSEPYCFL